MRAKRPERDANISFPSNAEVKKEWSFTSTHHARLHGVMISHRTITFIIENTKKIVVYVKVMLAALKKAANIVNTPFPF
jgi:hypothetical protein